MVPFVPLLFLVCLVLIALLGLQQCRLLRLSLTCLRETNEQLRAIRRECSTYAIERRLFALPMRRSERSTLI